MLPHGRTARRCCSSASLSVANMMTTAEADHRECVRSRTAGRTARSPTRRWVWQSLGKPTSKTEGSSTAAEPLGIAQQEVLVLNSLRRLLELGPAMMRTMAGWSGCTNTQHSPGAIRDPMRYNCTRARGRDTRICPEVLCSQSIVRTERWRWGSVCAAPSLRSGAAVA